MPALRLEFPFLWHDRVEGRAKRSVRDQPRPLLLNSYRGHMRCITCIAYIDEHKLVLRRVLTRGRHGRHGRLVAHAARLQRRDIGFCYLLYSNFEIEHETLGYNHAAVARTTRCACGA